VDPNYSGGTAFIQKGIGVWATKNYYLGLCDGKLKVSYGDGTGSDELQGDSLLETGV